jgi:hypothetical protein
MDGGYICCISGIRYDSVNSDAWVQTHRVTATHQENKDPLKLVRNTAFALNHKSTDTIRQQQHRFIAKQHVHAILFSNDRLFMEQRKYVEMKNEAEKAVQKYVKACEKSRQSIVFTTIVRLYIGQMNRRHIFRNLLPKDRSVDDIVQHYAKRACDYWCLMTQRLPLGAQTPALFPIKVFVISILYIMRAGLSLSGYWVIPADRYLKTILPEANTLDAYGVHKPGFTQCKNNILRAYREAKEQYNVDPRSLLLKT